MLEAPLQIFSTNKQFKGALVTTFLSHKPRITHHIIFFPLNSTGSDGKSHSFLLKGNEDIRQDERVVQLFGMVNTLLSADTKCNKQNLG